MFLVHSEKLVGKKYQETSENLKSKVLGIMQNQNRIDRYKYCAINICSRLFELIDKMAEHLSPEEKRRVAEMKDFLRSIYLDIESMTKI